MVAHTLDPSTRESQAFNASSREIETGRDMARQREEYKARGEGTQGTLRTQSEDFIEVRTSG